MTNQIMADVQLESTRERILLAAHEEMYEHGFQGLRIDAVLKKTHLAKGALYHYFPTKLALGYAVVDEVIVSYFQKNWEDFLRTSKDPLRALQEFFQIKCADIQAGECANGCPLNNLMQEMSTLDEGFHHRLQTVVKDIVCTVTKALEQGQREGIVRTDINAKKIATFVFSSYQGIMGAAKCMQSVELAIDLFETLNDYIESLRVRSQ